MSTTSVRRTLTQYLVRTRDCEHDRDTAPNVQAGPRLRHQILSLLAALHLFASCSSRMPCISLGRRPLGSVPSAAIQPSQVLTAPFTPDPTAYLLYTTPASPRLRRRPVLGAAAAATAPPRRVAAASRRRRVIARTSSSPPPPGAGQLAAASCLAARRPDAVRPREARAGGVGLGDVDGPVVRQRVGAAHEHPLRRVRHAQCEQ